MSAVEGLQQVLAAEHAAVYGYGVVAAQTIGAQRRAALGALDGHRARRDRVRAMLSAANAIPVESAIAYRLPTPVRSAAAAARLAADTEREVALTLGALVEAGRSVEREFAATALQETAVRETYWRGNAPQLPGLPTPLDPTASPSPTS